MALAAVSPLRNELHRCYGRIQHEYVISRPALGQNFRPRVTEARNARRVKDLNGKDEAELAELLRAAIAGDERAYTAFLEGVAALIRGFAQKRIVRGGIDSEDIVQETLLAIHVKRHTWISEAPVLPWVYAIAKYKLIDAF